MARRPGRRHPSREPTAPYHDTFQQSDVQGMVLFLSPPFAKNGERFRSNTMHEPQPVMVLTSACPQVKVYIPHKELHCFTNTTCRVNSNDPTIPILP